MAKKKKTVKRTSGNSSYGSTDSKTLLLIVGGGFIIIIMAFYFLTNMPSGKIANSNAVKQNETTVAKDHEVTIQNYAYSPSNITVKVGGRVTWLNKDTVGHSATADDKSFDTGVLQAGESSSITFAEAGTFPYHCSIHPNMTGTIVVEK